MADGVIFLQWRQYQDGDEPGLFAQEPLSFNSRQERLHQLGTGDRLWLVSRHPDDQQYYFVGVLLLTGQRRNAPGSREAQLFGEYAVLADWSQSYNLGTRFPAEGLLRALQFDPAKPIKYGASLGHPLRPSEGRLRSLLDRAERRSRPVPDGQLGHGVPANPLQGLRPGAGMGLSHGRRLLLSELVAGFLAVAVGRLAGRPRQAVPPSARSANTVAGRPVGSQSDEVCLPRCHGGKWANGRLFWRKSL